MMRRVCYRHFLYGGFYFWSVHCFKSLYLSKDRPLIQPPRQGSIVKTDQKQVYLPELIQSWFDKEDNK